MATTDAFPAEEYGTGSSGRRASLAPAERAFLESAPVYSDPPPPPELAAPPVTVPSLARRILSMLLFITLLSGACAVLGLAVMRMLGHQILP